MEPTRKEIFAILFREHERGLRAFVRACVHDRGDAEDLVQETFAAAWQHLDRYDPERPFAGWVRGIARRKIAGYYLRRANERGRPLILPPEKVTAIADEFERFNKPARGEAYGDCFAALRECLEWLGQDDKEIVQRAYGGNQTCRVIADNVGRTVDSVKQRLRRARAQLRDCILGKLGAETGNE